MSEKRFRVMDNDSKQLYCIEGVDGEMFSMQEIVDLLNEQQATINELKEAIDYLKTVIRYTIPNEMVADVFKRIGEEYD